MRGREICGRGAEVGALLREMNGFVELGMHRPALALLRRIFKATPLSGGEFEDALHKLLCTAGDLKRWQPAVAAAYDHLSSRDRKSAAAWMLAFYGSIPNGKIPPEFVEAKAATPIAAFFTMPVLIQRRELSAARSLMRRCLRLLDGACDQMDKDMLQQSIASYHAMAGNYPLARRHWSAVSMVAIGQQAIRGQIDLHLASALREARAQLQRWERGRRGHDRKLAISHPGLEDKVTREFSDHLKTRIRRMERMLGTAGQKQFGL